MNARPDADSKTTRTITLPDRLWEFLRAEAEREHRSVNGQVAALVERAAEAANA